VLYVTHLLLILLALTPQPDWKRLQCTGEFISGRYINYAVGYSVGIPTGLKGKRGQASGPERGFSIPLSANCSGVIAFDGEPNSLEWKNAHVAAMERASYYDNTVVLRRYRTKLGRLPALGVRLRYRDTLDIDEFVVALRPGGALVYTAHLGTTTSRYRQDHRRFVDVLRRFRLEPWR
jgi:hypothetical protein